MGRGLAPFDREAKRCLTWITRLCSVPGTAVISEVIGETVNETAARTGGAPNSTTAATHPVMVQLAMGLPPHFTAELTITVHSGCRSVSSRRCWTCRRSY